MLMYRTRPFLRLTVYNDTPEERGIEKVSLETIFCVSETESENIRGGTHHSTDEVVYGAIQEE